MTNRRGTPRKVLSDNGKTFIRADKEIRNRMLENKEEMILGDKSNIVWKFTPPFAPNFGGVHESLVKSAKRALHHVLEQAEIYGEEL